MYNQKQELQKETKQNKEPQTILFFVGYFFVCFFFFNKSINN